MEIIGKYGFNDIFKAIKLAYQNDKKIYFFSEKARIPGGWRFDNDALKYDWVLNGMFPNATKTIESIRFEIPVELKPSDITRQDFDFSNSIFYTFLNELNLTEDNSYIQTALKTGDTFKVNDYKIIKTPNNYKLELIASDTISETIYKDNFKFGDNEYGHVTFGGELTTVPILFSDILKNLYKIEINNPRILLDFISIIEDLGRKNFNSEYIIGYSSVITALNIKFLNEILKSKNKEILTDDELQIAHFNFSEIRGREVINFNYYPLDKISFNPEFDFSKSSFPIFIYPDLSNIKWDHSSGALNKFTYNYFVQISDNAVDTIGFYEILDMNRNPVDSKKHRDFLSDGSIKIIKANFIINDGGIIPKEDLANVLSTITEGMMDNLRVKWKRVLDRYRRLSNNTSSDLEESFLALRFIKRHFSIIEQMNYNNRFLFLNDTMNPVRVFFDDVYEDYENFFGLDAVSNYTKHISSFNLLPLVWSNSRIEKGTINLKRIKFDNGDRYFASYIGTLFPENKLTEVSNRWGSWRNSKNMILINDSGNKQAWKKKTREFLKLVSRNFSSIIILDPQDKIQLKLLLRVFGKSGHTIRYSDFEKEITIEKKSVIDAPEKGITFYTSDSFSSNATPVPRNGNSTDFISDDIIITEFQSTKKLFNYKGNNYSVSEFNIKEFNQILGATGKKLRAVSKNNYKKLVEAGAKTLEYWIKNEAEKDLENIHDHFIIYPEGTTRDSIYTTRRFFKYLVIEPLLYPNRNGFSPIIKEESGDIVFSLLNELPQEVKTLFNKMQMVVDNGKGNMLGASVGQIEYIHGSKILIRKNKGFLAEIYAKIPKILEENDYKQSAEICQNIAARYQPEMTSRLENILYEWNELLQESNYLNLDTMDKIQLIDDFKRFLYTRIYSVKKMFDAEIKRYHKLKGG